MNPIPKCEVGSCKFMEDLLSFPDGCISVTWDSVENRKLKDNYTQDPNGLLCCTRCGYTAMAHRRKMVPSFAVTRPTPAEPRTVDSLADIRECCRADVPDKVAMELFRLYIGQTINSDLCRLIADDYASIKRRAGTTTRLAFTVNSQISLSGLYDKGKHPQLMTGLHQTTGHPYIIKFIPEPPSTIPDHPFAKPGAASPKNMYAVYMEHQVAKLSKSCPELVQCEIFPGYTQSINEDNKDEDDAVPKLGIAMEHFPLTAARCVPLPHDTLARIIRPIGAALTFLHENNIVHMDVKPSNIFITHDGQWKLGDFDAACFVGEYIYATTNAFHLNTTNLNGAATKEHDWGMLLCTLAELMEHNAYNRSKVACAFKQDMSCGQFMPHERARILDTAEGELRDLIHDWKRNAGTM